MDLKAVVIPKTNNKNHWAFRTSATNSKLPTKDAKNFWKYGNLGALPCNNCVVAQDGETVAGFLRIYVTRRRGRTVKAVGTWVAPKYRKSGVAKLLWTTMHKEFKPLSVQVNTISKGGGNLVEWYLSTHKPKRIEWNRWE
jgi:hypothetical protein